LTRRTRLSFLLKDAQAEWAGSALAHVFPDGVVVEAAPSKFLSRISGWLPPSLNRRLPQIKIELAAFGATALKVTQEPARGWNPAGAAPFPLVKMGRFVMVPAGHKGALPKKAEPVHLIQAQAFGTGLHESTRLMVKGLQALDLKAADILDVGAGSGILGFVALALGAKRVTCVEVESAACAELRLNRALNKRRPGQMPVLCGRYPLKRLAGKRYPLVLGNLVTPVLEALMPALKKQLAPKGRLICSGIHTPGEAARVRAAARAAGLKPAGSESLRRWYRMEFIKL
jgi:ribosomal protein L11 methyltransferase